MLSLNPEKAEAVLVEENRNYQGNSTTSAKLKWVKQSAAFEKPLSIHYH